MSKTNQAVLGINLRKNNNSKSLAFGKWYPEVDRQKTLTIRGFAQHMIDLPVQLGELGIFYPSIEGIGISEIQAGMDPRDSVRAVHLRFLPNSAKLGDLSGKAFKDACTLELRNIIVSKSDKGKLYHTYKPISTYLYEQSQPEPEPEP